LKKSYLQRIEQELSNWKYASEVKVVNKKIFATIDAAYIRIRVSLINGDLLEISEYLSFETGRPQRLSYSYHWQNSQQKLLKRWDNAPHHPQAKGYPHHVHEGSEDNILASEPIRLDRLLKEIEKAIKP
jgi:hypothetical protein